MKTVYMIYDRDIGSTGIFFDDEKTAQKYCQLRNDKYSINGSAANSFTYVKQNMYKSMQDYKMENKEEYKQYLQDAIMGLKENIKSIELNQHVFSIKLNDDFYFRSDLLGLRTLLRIVNEGKFQEDTYRAQTYGYETMFGWHEGKTRKVNCDDLIVIEKGYERIKKDFDNMKLRLKDYKKEYIALACEDKNKQTDLSDEKELTK